MRKERTFLGYSRENGTFGIRNHVVALATSDALNPLARQISQSVQGVVALTHGAGRCQFGKDHQQTQRTLRGLIANPNVASVLLLSMESTLAAEIGADIAKTGKMIEQVIIQECGTIDALARGIRKAAALAIAASEERRRPVPLDALTLAVECGGSDTTSGIAANPVIGKIADIIVDAGGTVILSETVEMMGAEHILAKRAASDDLARKIYAMVDAVEADAKRRGIDIRGTNPLPDNIRGGLSSIEEKALGAIIKGGTRPIRDVVEYGETSRQKGLILMDTPSGAIDGLTGMAAGGATMVLFSTGVGHPAGHPIMPTIKITSNPKTEVHFIDNIDFSVTSVALGLTSIEDAADKLLEEVIKVASGKIVKAEALKQLENGIARIEPSI
ncbi:MAG: UxaA family hydrolase [Syntrophobacter sp.]